jgi:hypothetical protein
MPATANPSTGGGGYVIGMLNNPTRLFWAFATFQSPGACTRSSRTKPSLRWMLPNVKPKIPCLPGFTPVKIEVQPGGVYGGTVDVRFPCTPLSRSALRRGMWPASNAGVIIR